MNIMPENPMSSVDQLLQIKRMGTAKYHPLYGMNILPRIQPIQCFQGKMSLDIQFIIDKSKKYFDQEPKAWPLVLRWLRDIGMHLLSGEAGHGVRLGLAGFDDAIYPDYRFTSSFEDFSNSLLTMASNCAQIPCFPSITRSNIARALLHSAKKLHSLRRSNLVSSSQRRQIIVYLGPAVTDMNATQYKAICDDELSIKEPTKNVAECINILSKKIENSGIEVFSILLRQEAIRKSLESKVFKRTTTTHLPTLGSSRNDQLHIQWMSQLSSDNLDRVFLGKLLCNDSFQLPSYRSEDRVCHCHCINASASIVKKYSLTSPCIDQGFLQLSPVRAKIKDAKDTLFDFVNASKHHIDQIDSNGVF